MHLILEPLEVNFETQDFAISDADWTKIQASLGILSDAVKDQTVADLDVTARFDSAEQRFRLEANLNTAEGPSRATEVDTDLTGAFEKCTRTLVERLASPQDSVQAVNNAEEELDFDLDEGL